jgi:hypothetical protein
MTTRKFFTATLFVPLIAGLIGLFTPAKVLLVALLFGGVPYILLALVLARLILRSRTKSRLIRLSLLSPVAFMPLVILFVMIVGSSPTTGQVSAGETAMQILPFAVYTLVFGYFYVLVAWALWFLATKIGFVVDEFSETQS